MSRLLNCIRTESIPVSLTPIQMHPHLFKSEIFPFTQCTCPFSAHVQVQLLKVIIIGKENLDNANRHTNDGSVCSNAAVKLADPTGSFRIYHFLLNNVTASPFCTPPPPPLFVYDKTSNTTGLEPMPASAN